MDENAQWSELWRARLDAAHARMVKALEDVTVSEKPSPCGDADEDVTATEAQRRRRLLARAPNLAKSCAHCGEPMEAMRTTSKFCSSTYRVATLRARGNADARVAVSGAQ